MLVELFAACLLSSLAVTIIARAVFEFSRSVRINGQKKNKTLRPFESREGAAIRKFKPKGCATRLYSGSQDFKLDTPPCVTSGPCNLPTGYKPQSEGVIWGIYPLLL